MPIYDLQLLSSAAHFNLKEGAERRRSVYELVNLFYLLQDGLKPDFCLEVGAFDAKFSQRMAKTGMSCYAFEANPHNYTHFRQALDIPNLQYIHTAISDAVGTVTFMIQNAIDGKSLDPVGGNNSIKPRTNTGIDYQRVEVPSTTLERFLRDRALLGSKYGMWIDVEGATSEVLQASKDALRDCQSIFIEVEENAFWEGQWLAWDVSRFLSELGFAPIARDFETHKQYNVVYVRKELLSGNAAVRAALTMYFTRIGKRWA